MDMVRGAHMDREERGREEEGRRGRDNPRVLDVRPGKGREEGRGRDRREEGRSREGVEWERVRREEKGRRRSRSREKKRSRSRDRTKRKERSISPYMLAMEKWNKFKKAEKVMLNQMKTKREVFDKRPEDHPR